MESAFSHPIRKGTIRGLLESLQEIVSNDTFENREKVYYQIARFLRSKMRLELSQKFEKGKLKIKDSLGDSTFVEGNIKREKGLWHYATGS